MAVIQKCLQTRSFEEVSQMISLAFENVDTNLSAEYILSYLVYGYNFNTENLTMEQLPGESVYSNEAWVFEINKQEAQNCFSKIMEDFFE